MYITKEVVINESSRNLLRETVQRSFTKIKFYLEKNCFFISTIECEFFCLRVILLSIKLQRVLYSRQFHQTIRILTIHSALNTAIRVLCGVNVKRDRCGIKFSRDIYHTFVALNATLNVGDTSQYLQKLVSSARDFMGHLQTNEKHAR